ncbi:MAG: cation diffusion facilitator family transporter [Solirubrobacteraceae bacterium]
MTDRRPADQGLAQQRTTLVSLAAASTLVILKLGAGLTSGSLALISAGIESSGDVLAAALTFFAVRLGGRPADREHPYGHRRAENLGALGEAAILLVGAVVIAVEAISHLTVSTKAPEAGLLLFVVVAVALVVDISRTVVSLRTARRYRSAALRSNAFHFAGDAASSVVVLVGLLLVRAGFTEGDAVSALLIAVLILAAAVRLIGENANVLMDRSPPEAREAAEHALEELEPDIQLLRLRVRESAGRYFVDVVAAVAPGQAVIAGHLAADLVERTVERVLGGSDVVVHIEPRRSGLDLRERILAIALAEPLVEEVHDITIFEQEATASVSLHLKFPAELDLSTAQAVAERIELAILASAGVTDVQTHLEPLERPMSAPAEDGGDEQHTRQQIQDLVRARTGVEAQRVRLLPTSGGRVLFLTLGVGEAASLIDAHRLASELEEELRNQIPNLADVVVRTET